MCSQVLALAVVVMVGVWMGSFNGGFAWHDNVYLEFNYHPLFMILGLVFLYGNGTWSCSLFWSLYGLYGRDGTVLVGCHNGGWIAFHFVDFKHTPWSKKFTVLVSRRAVELTHVKELIAIKKIKVGKIFNTWQNIVHIDKILYTLLKIAKSDFTLLANYCLLFNS